MVTNEFDDIPPSDDEMNLAIKILRSAGGERIDLSDYNIVDVNNAARNLMIRGLILGYETATKKIKWTNLTASGKKALRDITNRSEY
jgi:hypothetical protein